MSVEQITGRVLLEHTKSHTLPPATHYVVQKPGKFVVRKYQAKQAPRVVYDVAIVPNDTGYAEFYRMSKSTYDNLCKKLQADDRFNPEVRIAVNPVPSYPSHTRRVLATRVM